MKIAITSMGKDLNDKVDPRFGRCRIFIIYDLDTNQFEAIENKNAQGMGGVGIQSGQMMADRGVKTVLTGNCGPNAFQTLNAAGIEIVAGVKGTIQEVIDKYKSGQYQKISGASTSAHSGMQ